MPTLLSLSARPCRPHGLLLALVLLTLLWSAPASHGQASGSPPPPPGNSNYALLTSVSTSPTSVIGGAASTGTVTVNGTAAQSASVSLSSSTASVQVSSSVTVAGTATSAAFSITTTAVSSPVTATITATELYASGGVYRTIQVTTTLTVAPAPAPAVPAYLSNLTLSSTTVTGGGSLTGTVTLSSPASANITVALHSNNSVATVPATCTILANTSQATFSIKTTAVSVSAYVTLSASYNGWTQGSTLNVQPSNPPAAPPPGVPTIRVAPGNGCAVVSWTRLANGTVSGYNVYRTSGGTTTRLTSTPFASNFYPDTGLTNDTTTYTYQVSAVDTQGHEQALSAPVSATPSSATATLNWNNPPSAVTGNTGNTILSLSWSSAVPSFGTLLFVDGVQAGSAGTDSNYVNGVQTYTTRGGFDFSKLSNGPHIVQYLGFADANETVAGITPPVTIQVSNTISNDNVDNDWFDPTQGDLCYLSATVPAGSTWTVQVTPQDSTTVLRTWQGASSLVKLAWDGKDTAGNLVPLTDYTLALTVQPPGTSPSAKSPQTAPNAAGTVNTKKHPTKVLHGQPAALALISVGASYYKDASGNTITTPAQDIQLANVLTTAYTTLYGANNFQVIRSDTFDPTHVNASVTKNGVKVDVTDLDTLKGWLGTVQVFYVFGHGAGTDGLPGPSQTPRSTAWNGVGSSYTNRIELFPTATVPSAPDDFNILVPNYVGNHHYVFAWIDSCNSAGGNLVTGEVGTADYIWSRAFNNPDTFIGSNGVVTVNNSGPTNPSDFYTWRNKFWTNLETGQDVQDAYTSCWKDQYGIVGNVNTSQYHDYYFVGSNRYDCTPGDGYGGNPRIVLYGDPLGTSLTPQ